MAACAAIPDGCLRTCVLLAERREVVHPAQVRDPAVRRRVVRGYLTRSEVSRAGHG